MNLLISRMTIESQALQLLSIVFYDPIPPPSLSLSFFYCHEISKAAEGCVYIKIDKN